MHEQCTVVYPEAVDECTVCSRCTWKLGIYAQYTVVYLEAGDVCTVHTSVPGSLDVCTVYSSVPGSWRCMCSVQ